MSTNRGFDFAQLDQRLLTWGVARHAGARFVVAAAARRELAVKAADAAPRVTVTGVGEQAGRTVADVYPLVYHHPDLGWVLAAVGWPVAT